MPIPEHIPEVLKQFWSENPTQYTKDDIHHLEPDSLISSQLKYLLENGFATLTLKLNGKVIGEFNGGEPLDLDIVLGNLTVQRNGVNVGTYNGSDNKTIDIALGTLAVQKNGTNIGTYNGSNNSTVNVQVSNLTIQRNGTTIVTYNGDNSATANINVPVITYGTSAPSGGNVGDVYMRYLA